MESNVIYRMVPHQMGDRHLPDPTRVTLNAEIPSAALISIRAKC